MAMGTRIRHFRNKRCMTMKTLGAKVGFLEASADIRIAQYENESRTPKQDLILKLADALNVSPQALTVPDIDSDLSLLYTLFAIEDMHGITIERKEDNETALILAPRQGKTCTAFQYMLAEWAEQAYIFYNGEITQEEYDQWRYNYS